MRILVTGAGGFLGVFLLAALREHFPNAQLLGVVRRPPQTRIAGVEYCDRLERADFTFHLAGGGGVAASLRDPRSDLFLNAVTAVEILEQLNQDTGRLVVASSAAIYGNVSGTVPEDRPANPMSPYGVSKLAVEAYVHVYERLRGVRASIARIGNAYGPGQRQLAIYDLAVRALSAEPPLRIRGTGNEIRDFVHARDVAEALIRIATAGDDGATYNVASGHPVTMKEVAALVADAAGLGVDAVVPDAATESGKTTVFCPSIARLSSLGFVAKIPLSEGIKETVQWVRSEL